jgi:hypothetical protein
MTFRSFARFLFCTTFGIGLLACQAASSGNLSLHDAWLGAPKIQGSHWNREPQLDRMVAGVELTGMPRAKVLDLFGQPGYSAENYPGPSRIDEYRLSARNDKTFRIDYNAEGHVTEDSVESSPCNCPLCTTKAPPLSVAVLRKKGLLRDEPPSENITVAAFEKKLGGQGQLDLSHNVVGGQVWLNYSETWRISDTPNQFLIADGHVPARTAPTDEISDKLIESWALVAFAPECLAQ